MAVRLTKKAIVLLSVLGLLVFGGITGYLVWTVYFQDNVAPTDSEAGSSCGSNSTPSSCSNACGPKKGGAEYGFKCKWINGACKEGATPCSSGSGDTPGEHVCKTLPNTGTPEIERCETIGATSCQTNAQGKRTGYNCTCLDLSTALACKKVWNCATLDTKACPQEVDAPPKFNCTVTGNCISLPAGGTTTWYEHRCSGAKEGDNSNGCTVESPIKHANQASFCMTKPAGFCGWIQVDSEGYKTGTAGCFGSWYFPCDDDDDEPPVTVANPPVCTALALTSTPNVSANPIVLSSVNDQVTATLTSSDPDGTPSKVRVCYSIRGQSAEFYRTMTNWVCSERANSATMSVNSTLADMITTLATKVSFTEQQIEDAGLTFMSEVYDNSDSKVCTSNPGYTNGGTSVIQGTSTPCGGACVGAVSLSEAPPACGDGILDPGEVCDPGATPGTPANSCTVGTCSTECTCPELNPGFNIQKVPVMQCVEGDQIYADVRYTIVVTNNGETVGHMSQVSDDLDPKVQRDWIIESSISPSQGVSIGAIADGPEGLEIIWTLDEASRTFDPGESMTFTYVIRIPQANFGNYRNVVTGIVTDEGEANVTDEAIIDVSCLPGTGLFDSTMARIALAGVLLITGAYFAQSRSLDGFVFSIFTKTGKVEHRRTKFEKSI